VRGTRSPCALWAAGHRPWLRGRIRSAVRRACNRPWLRGRIRPQTTRRPDRDFHAARRTSSRGRCCVRRRWIRPWSENVRAGHSRARW